MGVVIRLEESIWLCKKGAWPKFELAGVNGPAVEAPLEVDCRGVSVWLLM